MTTDSTEPSVRERVKRALLMNALTDWRGGIVLAIAILLAFFGPDLFPAIPCVGVAASAAERPGAPSCGAFSTMKKRRRRWRPIC